MSADLVKYLAVSSSLISPMVLSLELSAGSILRSLGRDFFVGPLLPEIRHVGTDLLEEPVAPGVAVVVAASTAELAPGLILRGLFLEFLDRRWFVAIGSAHVSLLVGQRLA
jgi:hypothetical protein